MTRLGLTTSFVSRMVRNGFNPLDVFKKTFEQGESAASEGKSPLDVFGNMLPGSASASAVVRGPRFGLSR